MREIPDHGSPGRLAPPADGRPALTMAAPPDLSIVLVNWNACDLTAAAIESIERQTRDLRYEVIVVDNGTTRDDSVRELPRRFPSIRLISNPRNMGFSVG